MDALYKEYRKYVKAVERKGWCPMPYGFWRNAK